MNPALSTWVTPAGEVALVSPTFASLSPPESLGATIENRPTESLIGFDTDQLRRALLIAKGPVTITLGAEATFTFPGGSTSIPYRERDREDELTQYLRTAARWEDTRWAGRSILGLAAAAAVARDIDLYPAFPVALSLLGETLFIRSQAVILKLRQHPSYAPPPGSAVDIPKKLVGQLVPEAHLSPSALYTIDHTPGGPRLVARYPSPSGAGFVISAGPLPTQASLDPSGVFDSVAPAESPTVRVKDLAEAVNRLVIIQEKSDPSPTVLSIDPSGMITLTQEGARSRTTLTLAGEASPVVWGKSYGLPTLLIKKILALCPGEATLVVPETPERGKGVRVKNLVVPIKGGYPLVGEGVVSLIHP